MEYNLIYREQGDDQKQEGQLLDVELRQLEKFDFVGSEHIQYISEHAVESHIMHSASLDTLPVTVGGAIIGYETQTDFKLLEREKKLIHRYAQHLLMNHTFKSN